MIRTVTATRYITPLREGGSLPAIVEADDGKLYAMKFVGAGQGHKALIAELVAGELARALGLRVPEIVFIELEKGFGASEPDPEIHDLLRASAGLNLALRYLPQAFPFNILLAPPPQPEEASMIVWFDAYVINIDRTPRNANMLVWEDDLWLIDHGAALYFHHTWHQYMERSDTPFTQIEDHTLLSLAKLLEQADDHAHSHLTPDVVTTIVAHIPDEWLVVESPFETEAEHREAYVAYLLSRLEASQEFVEEAKRARARIL